MNKDKKRPLIGIPGFLNSDKMFGVTGNYMQFANSFGDVRIIMPHEEFVEVDLLLLPGGLDLSSTSYKAIPSYQSTNHDVFKEFFFKTRLKTYIDAKTPIFGICLGFQMLNVALGGTLKQHLVFHDQSNSRWSPAHVVNIHKFVTKKNQPFKDYKVNSHHHQAVLAETLAPGLEIIADIEDFDGHIVEAYRHTELPIAGVQWHPEELYDVISRALINGLLDYKKEG